MSRRDAAMHRRNTVKGFRSTFIPSPPDPTVDVDAIERRRPLHGYASVFKGAIVTVGLVLFCLGVGLVAVMFR